MMIIVIVNCVKNCSKKIKIIGFNKVHVDVIIHPDDIDDIGKYVCNLGIQAMKL